MSIYIYIYEHVPSIHSICNGDDDFIIMHSTRSIKISVGESAITFSKLRQSRGREEDISDRLLTDRILMSLRLFVASL